MKNYELFEAWMLDGAKLGLIGDESEYPIAGCRELMSLISERAAGRGAETVLCIGPGSEAAACMLYSGGAQIWLMDADEARLALLERRMPGVNTVCADIFEGFPDEIDYMEFDAVICTYIAHSLDDEDKTWMIEDLASLLSEGGVLYLGDVCFWTTAEREICRRRCADQWDDEDCYIVFDEFAKEYDSDCVRFTRVSHCAGLLEFSNDFRLIE